MKKVNIDPLNDKPVLQKIAKKIIPILKEAGVTKSSLFGSFVRGENKRGSDVDILVEVPRGTGLFKFAGLQIDLERALKKKVDLVTYDSIYKPLRKYILKEHIRIL